MDKTKIIGCINRHKRKPNLKFRLKENVEEFTELLFYTLFDAETPVEENLVLLEQKFEGLVNLACWDVEKPCLKIWEHYIQTLPEILRKLNLDAEAFHNCDPAASSVEEIYLAYPGFFALAIYRLAHELYTVGFPLVPRLMTEYAHRKTGVDINPGAQIGESIFLDHATGIVIGETATIKNHVKIYQGVTLGALYVDKDLRNTKRHPTIENNVTIYANATILGGDTVIGENSVIGGNAWVVSSVPPNTNIYHVPKIIIKTKKNVL